MSETKYPLSTHEKQCIGPCYFANTVTYHPTSLDEITATQNFCPVDKFVHNKDGKSVIYFIDSCHFPTNDGTGIGNDIDILFPSTQFDSDYFIKIYYKLNSLEEVINWLDTNKSLPFKTRERVFNNGMVVYANDINIVDNRMIQFINEGMIKNIKKMYVNLCKYIKIEGDTITIVPNGTVSCDKYTKIEKKIIMGYINEKFLGMNNVHQFMIKFFRHYKDQLNNSDLINLLVSYMIDYITKKITLDK